MLVIYNEMTVDAFAKVISQMNIDGKILIYVFSATRYACDENFEDVLDKVELCALPAAIYDAYRNILPEQQMEYESPLGEMTNDGEKGENRGIGERQLTMNFSEEGGEQ